MGPTCTSGQCARGQLSLAALLSLASSVPRVVPPPRYVNFSETSALVPQAGAPPFLATYVPSHSGSAVTAARQCCTRFSVVLRTDSSALCCFLLRGRISLGGG